MKQLLKRITSKLSYFTELTDEEKLKLLTKEERHDNLMADIRHIRHSGFYVPNYDKPNPLVKVAHPRPVDFGNDIEAWMKAVREQNSFDLKEKERKKQALKEDMNQRYFHIDIFMRQFMRVE